MKSKHPSEPAPKIPLEEILKAKAKEAPKKLDLKFFTGEEENAAKEPEVVLEVEEKRKPSGKIGEKTKASEPTQVEEEQAKFKIKVTQFTFYCPTCKKWYGLKEFAVVECPVCQQELQLSYYCSTCKKRFMVKEPGMFNCPVCNMKLMP